MPPSCHKAKWPNGRTPFYFNCTRFFNCILLSERTVLFLLFVLISHINSSSSPRTGELKRSWHFQIQNTKQECVVKLEIPAVCVSLCVCVRIDEIQLFAPLGHSSLVFGDQTQLKKRPSFEVQPKRRKRFKFSCLCLSPRCERSWGSRATFAFFPTDRDVSAGSDPSVQFMVTS